MKYDFSQVNRLGTDCTKFDLATQEGFPQDTLCYWVADMDFKTAPEIVARLKERVENGVFGYTTVGERYRNTVASWYKNRFGYTIDPAWLVSTPGVVFAFNTAITAYTEPGDAVLITRPVYYPFSNTINANGRRLVNSALVNNAGRYGIDFDDFEKQVAENHVKLFILCNPHNPIGRSWTKAELERIAEICLKHGVLVVSDEIHSDFVWTGHSHTMFAGLSKEVEKSTITCTAPSKTFNIAGLEASNIFIADEGLRKRYQDQMNRIAVNSANLLGLTACEAAYTAGADWLAEAKTVIESNLAKTADYLHTHGGGKFVCTPMEATYLQWVDCRGLGLGDAELNGRLKKAGVWLDAGSMFGPEGEGFERINVATSWEYLEKGLERMVKALLA